MDKYRISGKNIIFYKNKTYTLDYVYSIGIKKYENRIDLEIYKIKENSMFSFFKELNFLNMIDKISFKLDEFDRVVGVNNYEDLKIKIRSKLILLEIKCPKLEEIIEFLDQKLEKVEDFLDSIFEIDFIDFLFCGNLEKRKNRNFYGVKPVENFEILIEMKKENSQENFIYSLEKESLNKKLLKYYINKEKIPNYFVEGKGVKIYLNDVLQSAKLELRSGEEEKFEREIHLNIEKE